MRAHSTGHTSDQRTVGQHHPARVDAEMPWEVDHLLCQFQGQRRNGRAILGEPFERPTTFFAFFSTAFTTSTASTASTAGAPSIDPLGEGVGVSGRDTDGLRHLPQRRARPVGDHVGHLGGALASVLVVDVLDHLLASLVLDVEVDVGRAVAFQRQETFEEQPELDRVGLGDTERVTHRAVRGAAPPLAVDVVHATELDDVDQHQEVAGEVELVDHVELVGDLAPSPARDANGSDG